MNLFDFAQGKTENEKHGEYPVTIAWQDGAVSYQNEFDLLVDCLNRAPNLIWYAKFLRFAKPEILNALPQGNETWPQFEQWQKSLTQKVNFEQGQLFAMPTGGGYYNE